MDDIRYQWSLFGDLDVYQLYSFLRLRQEIFVVEQECIYLDADGWDQQALHLLMSVGDVLAGYLRVILPGSDEKALVIGRVLVHGQFRRQGHARRLVSQALSYCRREYHDYDIVLSAQSYLVNFYEEMGFTVVSEPYDEDGIEHVRMEFGKGTI